MNASPRKMPKSIAVIMMTAWSVVMTALLAFFGGAVLRGLKSFSGSKLYWLAGTVATIALIAAGQSSLAIAFACMFLVVGTYSELEDMELSEGWSAFWAISIGILVGAAGVAFWIASYGKGWYQTLLGYMSTPMEQLAKFQPQTSVTAEDLLFQTPAVLVILVMLSLYMAVLFENRVLKLVHAPLVKRRSLKTFKVADLFLWVFLASILGTFLDHGLKPLAVVSANVLYVTLALYFFQGLAVIATGFSKIQLGVFWQILAYFILITQLLIVVCMVGVADFWFEFRNRWKKSAHNEMKREIFRK